MAFFIKNACCKRCTHDHIQCNCINVHGLQKLMLRKLLRKFCHEFPSCLDPGDAMVADIRTA